MLIDREEDRTLRAVLVGMLREQGDNGHAERSKCAVADRSWRIQDAFVEILETGYPRTGEGAHIAYPVIEDGSGGLVFVPGLEFNGEHAFEDVGEHELKGVPGPRWHLYRLLE